MDGGSYPLPAALKALGITEATASNWTRRRYDGAAVAPSGRGRPRQLSSVDVWRLAIMKALSDLGVAPARSDEWAQTSLGWMTRLGMDGRVTKSIYIRTYADGEVSVLPDPALMKTPPRPGAEAVLQLNLRAIIDRVRGELEAIKADD